MRSLGDEYHPPSSLWGVSHEEAVAAAETTNGLPTQQTSMTTTTTSTILEAPHPHPNRNRYHVARGDIRFDPEMKMQHRIPMHFLTRGPVIGKGSVSLVYRASLRQPHSAEDQVVAMKQLNLQAIENDTNAGFPLLRRCDRNDLVHAFMDSIRLASQLHHPRIVAFVGVAYHDISMTHDDNASSLSLIMEYIDGSDLWSAVQVATAALPSIPLSSSSSTDDRHHRRHQFHLPWLDDTCIMTKVDIVLAVAEALRYLHACTPMVLHRNLQARHVLLSINGEAKLKLGIWYPPPHRHLYHLPHENDDDEHGGDHFRGMNSSFNNVAWTAPEVLRGEQYREAADVYSFGILLSEVDTGMVPYAGYRKTILKENSDTISSSVSSSLSTLEEMPENMNMLGAAMAKRKKKKRSTLFEGAKKIRNHTNDDHESHAPSPLAVLIMDGKIQPAFSNQCPPKVG